MLRGSALEYTNQKCKNKETQTWVLHFLCWADNPTVNWCFTWRTEDLVGIHRQAPLCRHRLGSTVCMQHLRKGSKANCCAVSLTPLSVPVRLCCMNSTAARSSMHTLQYHLQPQDSADDEVTLTHLEMTFLLFLHSVVNGPSLKVAVFFLRKRSKTFSTNGESQWSTKCASPATPMVFWKVAPQH